MPKIRKIDVSAGIFWVEVPEAQLFMLCGCPADSVKHLMKRGLIVTTELDGLAYETGPNAILLSDAMIQNGNFANLAEFPVLQMLYRQGMILPNHPGNTGIKPLLVGSKEQVSAQMQYIYRGNYGLISEEEITGTGIPLTEARDMMRMKLKFAFGSIRHTSDLLDSRIVENDPVEILNGVSIRRLERNVFEIQYEEEKVNVDLNLKPHETYGIPYPLNYHNSEREYFAVIHSGEGDGWDINRPSMSSILMFQGKIYLIDAGPNIHYSLRALGIGINEIEGVFHTHSHDDHFCGLTTLMRGDRKIKYYATPLVRTSVTKKLSALLSIEEREFSSFFAFHDLAFDVWNDIGGMEVKPIFSPHPVETNLFIFRTIWGDRYQSYAHFADIVALDVLKEMIVEDDVEVGISQVFFEKVKESYLVEVELKKLDIGGGMIHGDAEDFRQDRTEKIVLAHTAFELTDQQKEIGSGAPFGTIDVLIPTTQDFSWGIASEFLHAYFPSVPVHEIGILLNNPIKVFNPESILLKKGEKTNDIFLVLTGSVEQIQTENRSNLLSAGALIGEAPGLLDEPSSETYRATSFSRVLQIPRGLYLSFVKRNDLYDRIKKLQERRDFLQRTWLLGEAVSCPTQSRIAETAQLRQYAEGCEITYDALSSLNIVVCGRVERFIRDDSFEIIGMGNFFGEESAVFGIPSVSHFRAIEPTEVYQIPGSVLADIPVIRWKLLETFEKRTGLVLSVESCSTPMFQWRDEYSVNIQSMDKHHRRLFTMSYKLYDAVDSGEARSALEDAFVFLVRYSEFHFSEEERLMAQYRYPDFEVHVKKHRDLLQEVLEFREEFRKGDVGINAEFIDFLKDWIVNHILAEDRKYGSFLNQKGVY